MAAWLDRLSIRSRLALLILAILLPVAAVLAWHLADELQQARAAARDRVRSLATGTAMELQRRLAEAERMLAVLAARPAVLALDAGACGPLALEYQVLIPAFHALTVRDPEGRIVCSAPQAAWAAQGGGAPVAQALQGPAQADGLHIGPLRVQPADGTRALALGHAIRSASGQWLGQLELEVDLLALSHILLPPAPDRAVTTVVDAGRMVLLRSADPEGFIGRRPHAGEADPSAGAREGYFEYLAPDGIPRLFAFVDLPLGGLRVAASLPLVDVRAAYQQTQRRTLAVAAGLALLALVLGWRLSRAIVRPVAGLRATAERVAAGDDSARSALQGPPEVHAVAQAFNRALDARAVSESRLRGIFSSAMDAIITCDDTMHIVEANPAAAQMFRCSVDSMIGAPLDRFIPARFRRMHAHHVRHFSTTATALRGAALQRMVLALRADGEEFPIEASVSQLVVGGTRLYTVIHRDITDRQQAELALRASAARLHRLLTHLPQAVIVCNAGHIDFVNQAACALLGLDAQALLQRSLLDFIPAGAQAQVAAALAGAGTTPLGELGIVRADGGSRQVESLVTPIDDGGGQAVLVVLSDISELKRAQTELATSHADLTRLVAELDLIAEAERRRIARELHDDLQQTLAAIRMEVSAINGGPGGVDPAVRPALTRVDALAGAAIASTRRIINDLRPQVLENLGLLAALEALTTRFELLHGVSCSLLTSGLEPDDARIDPATATCLYRVAQEALNNVAKHARASHVRLELALVGPDRLRLAVSDDGLGMTDADLRKPESYGLLGMRERVQAAHGSLRVDGAAGKGTTLVAEIPLRAG